MNKYREALEILGRALKFYDEGDFQSGRLWRIIFNDMVDDKEKFTIEQALECLEEVDNAKTNDALEKLDLIIEMFNKYANKPNDIGEFFKFTKAHEIVKQALQQAEKEHKALEIIKKRQIDITDITETTDDFELYQAYCIGKGYAEEYICNKEEFELLKECLVNEK